MRVLLDTHAFLWWADDDPRLSLRAREVIGSADVEVFFSAASAWEIVVKASLGRLRLHRDPESLIGELLDKNAFQALPIHLRHAFAVSELPDLHRDPFDGMIVAQARSEGLAIVSGDRRVSQYPVDVVW